MKQLININKLHREKLTKAEKIAHFITARIGTMPFFVICNILVLLSLTVKSSISVVQFISSSWLQLILLPLIMIEQNRQSKHDELRAEHDYELDKADYAIDLAADKKLDTIIRLLKQHGK